MCCTAGKTAWKLSLALMGLLFWYSPANAQTPSVQTNQPFRVQATHDGANTELYRLYVDGVQVGPDVPVSQALSGTTVTLPHAGLSQRGGHTVQIAALNSDHPEVRSAPLAFDVKMPPPNAPTGVVLVTVQMAIQFHADGSASVARLSVGAVPEQAGQ